jgi:glycosyltransferase involved in cell wall biosynthesis
MAERIVAKGAARERVVEVPVWSRAEEIAPLEHKDNALRTELGWQDRFVVLYSGNAGLLHRFDELLEAARRLAERVPEVLFAFVGGGPRRAEIERRAAELGLTNVAFLPYFPRERLGESLPAGDVHFLSLAPEQTGIAVPGKLYGALASGRPVLFVGARDGESADTIRDARAGCTFVPGQGAELAVEIERLARDPAAVRELGANARAAFEQRFERELACEAWRSTLEVFGAQARLLQPARAA